MVLITLNCKMVMTLKDCVALLAGTSCMPKTECCIFFKEQHQYSDQELLFVVCDKIFLRSLSMLLRSL